MGISDFLQLDWVLNLEFEGLENPGAATSMAELERRVAPFVDGLWPSSKNKPTSRSDELWYLATLFREGPEEGREQLEGTEIFAYEKLFDGAAANRVDRLTDERCEPLDGSLERFRTLLLRHLKPHLEDRGLWRGGDQLTLAYGDTHRGGFGKLATGQEGDAPIRVYNTGGWVVPAGGGHPASYIFAVDESGEEYLIDIAFDRERVRVGDDALLDLASRDVEHRLEAVDNNVRALGATFRFFKALW